MTKKCPLVALISSATISLIFLKYILFFSHIWSTSVAISDDITFFPVLKALWYVLHKLPTLKQAAPVGASINTSSSLKFK